MIYVCIMETGSHAMVPAAAALVQFVTAIVMVMQRVQYDRCYRIYLSPSRRTTSMPIFSSMKCALA